MLEATEDCAMKEDVINEINRDCLATRTRRISRVITAIYDEKLRQFGINSPQFTLLVVIARLGPVSGAEIGRANHQERSTLSRNLQLMLTAGWIEEATKEASGRSRPVALTKAGREMLREAAPAWRDAQAQARVLLGEGGAAAIKNIADDL
jgi:DNA-binding MarR family transcriptional regulator